MSDAAGVLADLDDILTLAGRLADAARAEILPRFRTGIDHDDKDDASPVTAADRAAERSMRDLITAHRPDDGIYGEEFGISNPDADTVWILDPIDGTKPFITGKPVFGTLIGVIRNGRAIAGVLDAPATGDRWIGAAGRPSTFNETPIRTRTGRTLDRAWLTATAHCMFEGRNLARFEALSAASQHTTYGSDCQGYGYLACGWLDLVCEDTLAPYDYAALIPIVEGAGGTMTDWTGAALTFPTDGAGKKHSVIAAGDASLHAAAVAILSD